MFQAKIILIAVVLVMGWGMALKGRKVERGVESQMGEGARSEARYLALGDSYTIGESVGPDERYPAQVRRVLTEEDHLDCGDPEIIAVTGWTTGNLLDALADAKPGGGDSRATRGEDGRATLGEDGRATLGEDGRATSRGIAGEPEELAYDMVSLLIGVNNQYQGRSQAEYREQFAVLLQKSIRLAGNRPSHVLVLSIPDYSVTPFARMQGRDTTWIAAQIDSFNRINYELAREYRVGYLDVTAESRKAAADPSLIAADGLHFSGKEYEAWARLMEPVLREILKAGH